MTAGGGGLSPRLDEIDVVIFDKDGTLIEFDAMWGGWALELATRLGRAVGKPVAPGLFAMLGYDPETGRVLPGGALIATPMARTRDRVLELLIDDGLTARAAGRALDEAWHAPDPVGLARPLADLEGLFGSLHAGAKRIAVATNDDREPTERTLTALSLAGLIDASVCADDGIAVKPAPDMVLYLCAKLGIQPSRVAVVGDSGADLEMGRGAGAGLVVGVLTGVGGRASLARDADLILASVADLALN
ncbi:MAG: HAD family hydrolase [Chloroflexota bacterium]